MDETTRVGNPATSATPDDSSRRFYHGTRADLKPNDLVQPGYSSNYTERRSPWVYFSETLEAATWGAESGTQGWAASRNAARHFVGFLTMRHRCSE